MGLIFLTGMTGSGKTTVGEKLAARLGMPFVDADHEIERATGKTISEIFAAGGEPEFRDCEAVVLSVAVELHDVVIALGAGALAADENFELVQDSGTLIYLRASLPILAERLRNAEGRPMLAKSKSAADLTQRLQELLKQREARYLTADIVADVDGRNPDEIVELIVRKAASS
jgi:shikimate kinase